MAAEVTLVTEKNGKHIDDHKDLVCEQVEELKLINATLLAENDMLDRFLGRLDPQDLLSHPDGDVPGFTAGYQSKGEGGGWGRTFRPNASEHLQLLTLEQKLYVAQREVAETRKDKEKLQWRHQRIQDSYKAALNEAELRLNDIRKARSVFERKVVKPMKEHKLEMKDPERVLHYFADKLKVNQSEKFKLKNQSLKAQEQKLLQQLQQRKQMGKAKNEGVFLDYSEPGLENNQDELQINNVKVQRNLSTHKKKLQNVTSESAALSSDITRTKKMLEKIENEIKHAEQDCLKAEVLNQRLRHQLSEFEAPGTMEYLQVRNKHSKLKQSVQTWERKVGIAEFALKIHSKAGSKSAHAAARTWKHNIPVKLPQIAEKDTLN
uniref:Cilia- and flagella-associated protein 263 n=1 Tax=Gouania willdenowi TaxID=441366 RepID=A0A8C5DKA8_GOUWI